MLPMSGGGEAAGVGPAAAPPMRHEAERVQELTVRPTRAPAEAVEVRRVAVLHLRPAPTAEEQARALRRRGQRLTWDPQVQDNPNQRVSKSCCVFHKKKLFGESSSSDSSSSDSDSDSDEQHNSGVPMPDGLHGDGAAASGGNEHAQPAEGNNNESHDEAHAGCTHKHHRHQRPKCTKEHCYCGTRFH